MIAKKWFWSCLWFVNLRLGTSYLVRRTKNFLLKPKWAPNFEISNKKVKDCEVLLVRPRKVFWYVSVTQTFAGEQEIIGKAFQLYSIVARPICSIWKSKIYQLSRRFLRQLLSYFTIFHSFLPILTGWGRQFFLLFQLKPQEKY